jgi:glycosyltransferase involved in cell wall biosynthesis
MRDTFRSWGHPADVYALSLDDNLISEGYAFQEFRPGRTDDVVIMHYALPSALTPALREHTGRRILIHHNITPPEFFAEYDPEMARICALGREQLSTLADSVDLALGDSEFNRQELEANGFQRTGVLPIYLDFERYAQQTNPTLSRMLRDGRTNLLFVGRISPNKRPEDLIRVAAYWKHHISPDVRLILVGKLPRRETGEGRPVQRHYLDGLLNLAHEEGLREDDLLLTGHVDHADLLACYRTADVFLSMSEHEGFGVPLVEAMLMNVPVLAYRTTAVGDTLGSAGVQFTEKHIPLIAEMAHELARDSALRGAIRETQGSRLEAFAPATVEAILSRHLATVIST